MQSKLSHSVIILFILFFLTQNQYSYGQQDSTETPENLQERLERRRAAKKAARRKNFLRSLPKNHNPKTATLLALIPGMGQIYNRRYWKLPIVYGGLGALGYFMVDGYVEYNCFRTAYLHRVDGNPDTNYECPRVSSSIDSLSLKLFRDNARQNAESFLLGFTLAYGLSILDAFVDAHLMHFDISDDLSLRIEPSVRYYQATQQVLPTIGLAIQPNYNSRRRPFPVRF